MPRPVSRPGCSTRGRPTPSTTRWSRCPSGGEWEAAILNAQEHLHALGITAWQDAWVTPGTHDAYRALAADGRLTARVVGALWWDRHQGLEQIPQFLAQRENGVIGNYNATSVKIMTDGVLENYTGALLEPYCDGCGGHTDNHGLSYVEHDLLGAAVTELDRLGFQVHMHAIGDRAVRNALDAVAAARSANGMSDQRHHIAHVQIVHPDDVPRFAEVGAIVNCQPLWAQSDAQMEELTVPFLGRERVGMQYPFGAMLRSGARLAGGSDWSVTSANPLEEIDVMVNRRSPRHPDAPAFLPEERVAWRRLWRPSPQGRPTSTTTRRVDAWHRGCGPIWRCWTGTSSTSRRAPSLTPRST